MCADHGAQLVTIDLQTGAHRFDRPHALCGIGDMYMKAHTKIKEDPDCEPAEKKGIARKLR